MIPLVDVRLLRRLTTCLDQLALDTYLPGKNRCAAALILRFGNESAKKVTKLFTVYDTKLTSTEVLSRLEASTMETLPSDLQLLFVKRADIIGDRWSGAVAFPGGRRDPDDANDMDTVFRESYEILGIPLSSSRDFIYLGRLRDYQLQSRMITTRPMIQSRFVFLHIGDVTPSVKVADHEVHSVQWLPITEITAEKVHRSWVMHGVQSFIRASHPDWKTAAQDLLGNTQLFFPSVGLASSSLWRVWGLSLRSASEMLTIADGREECDWPRVTSDGAMLQLLVLSPMHGVLEIQQVMLRTRRITQLTVAHLLPLLSWLFFGYLVVVMVVYIICQIQRFFLIVGGYYQDPFGVEASTSTYFKEFGPGGEDAAKVSRSDEGSDDTGSREDDDYVEREPPDAIDDARTKYLGNVR